MSIDHPEPQTSTEMPGLPPQMRHHRPVRGPWIQWRHPRGLEWNVVELEIPGMTQALDGVRILHLSDLHLRPNWSTTYDAFHARLRIEPPDLLLLTGDYVESKYDPKPTLPCLERFLSGLTARYGIFGIRGNHDINLFGAPIENSAVRLIDGERTTAAVGDSSIELIGLPGMNRALLTPEFLAGIPDRKADVLRVVMSHFPDAILQIGHLRPDLILAGHTHGGQVCLPFGYAPKRNDSLPRRYCRGVHRLNDTWLCVTRGFGFSTWPLRLFCPAEVVEIRLKAVPR